MTIASYVNHAAILTLDSHSNILWRRRGGGGGRGSCMLSTKHVSQSCLEENVDGPVGDDNNYG